MGALFCNECGASLLEQQRRGQTAVLPFSEFIAPAPPSPLSDEELNFRADPKIITVVIPHSRRRLQLELVDEVRVGRSDPDFQPELDLTRDDGAEKGVSRLHAAIRSVRKGIVLIDLDSTNGTMLNTFRLPPERPYPLKNGDEIKFGECLIHIFFE